MRDNAKSGALTEVTFYILLSLYTPKHGYAVMQFVEEKTGGRLSLGAGTLYGALNSLQDKKWIEPYGDSEGRKKEYHITAQGKEIAEKELEEVKIEDEVTDVICEECGRNMVIKYGPHGKFLACPGFPECRNTKPYLEKIGVPCPVCGKEVVIRKTKKGRKYYGCEDNPECEFMSWQKPSSKKCPECGGYMVEKGNKLVCADEKCGYVETIKKED